MHRYLVSPIADERCDGLTAAVITETDDLAVAKEAAEHAPYQFGAGILDRQIGALDVGFGFGIPCPEMEG